MLNAKRTRLDRSSRWDALSAIIELTLFVGIDSMFCLALIFCETESAEEQDFFLYAGG